jgi:hypothetical protein
MKKNILLIIFTAVLSFSLGFYCCVLTAVPTKKAHVTKENPNVIKTTREHLDSLTIAANLYNGKENFPKKLSGKFIMKGATCAGLNFISPTRASWTNEMDCHPDTLRLSWINNVTFMTRLIDMRKGCPPTIWMYHVVSFDEKKLILREINTGWYDSKESRFELTRDTIE